MKGFTIRKKVAVDYNCSTVFCGTIESKGNVRRGFTRVNHVLPIVIVKKG